VCADRGLQGPRIAVNIGSATSELMIRLGPSLCDFFSWIPAHQGEGTRGHTNPEARSVACSTPEIGRDRAPRDGGALLPTPGGVDRFVIRGTPPRAWG